MKIESSKALDKIFQVQIKVAPKQATFLAKRFCDIELAEQTVLDQLAEWILLMVGDNLNEACEGYGFLTDILLEEELFFRRHGNYRRSTIYECDRDVYSNPVYMNKYLNGLLLSQLFWSNHTKLFQFYIDNFLKNSVNDTRLLEIGPGHGLLLSAAAAHKNISAVSGWDISQSSIEKTEKNLKALSVNAELCLRNVMENQNEVADFDMIILSELLEHLENPLKLLYRLFEGMKVGGRLFISMPVNSPAPDHIYLLHNPEEVFAMIKKAGFTINDTISAPATNNTLERAIKKCLTISVGVIATKNN